MLDAGLVGSVAPPAARAGKTFSTLELGMIPHPNMLDEEWRRWCDDSRGLACYVSSYGRVLRRSGDSPFFGTFRLGCQRLTVTLGSATSLFVHRLVAACFLDQPLVLEAWKDKLVVSSCTESPVGLLFLRYSSHALSLSLCLGSTLGYLIPRQSYCLTGVGDTIRECGGYVGYGQVRSQWSD